MISKRTLENYRSSALKYQRYAHVKSVSNQSAESLVEDIQKLCHMVLNMSRELLDQHLLNRGL